MNTPISIVSENQSKYHSSESYKVILWPFDHRGAKQFGIKPTRNGEPFLLVKAMGAKYSATHKCYYLENTKSNIQLVLDTFKNKAWVDMQALKRNVVVVELKKEKKISLGDKLNEKNATELLHFVNFMKARRMSKSSLRTYENMLKHFLVYFNDQEVSNIDDEMVKEFIANEVLAKGYSSSFQKQMISAIKLFYKERMHFKLHIERLPTVTSTRHLPKVLAVDEVRRIIECTVNIKHRTLLSLCYSCGLRVSEVLALQLNHINSNRMVVEVLNSKGNKDRIVPLSAKILQLLREYYKAFRPTKYLFEGEDVGTMYSAASANKVLKKSALKAGVKRDVHMHMLRHSYATHLLESGVDTRYIQKLLGHKSSKTTEIYTFVSNEKLENIPNPFDKLGLV